MVFAKIAWKIYYRSVCPVKNLLGGFCMKRNFFLRGCLLIGLMASVILAGCPGPTPAVVPDEIDPAMLAAPANVDRTVGPTSIVITWDAVTYATRYQIHITDGNGFDEMIEVTEGLAYTVEYLETDVAYTFSVRAGNSRGWSDNWSESMTATPQALLDVSVEVGDTTLSFSWDVWMGAINYQIQYRSGSEAWGTNEAFVSGTEHVFIGLINFMVYEVRVRPMTPAGPGEWSSVITAVPLPPAPPAPTNLALVTPVPIVINASWDAVPGLTADPALGGPIQTLYRVLLGTTNNVANAEQFGGSTAHLAARLDSLLGNTQYYVWVSAQYFFSEAAQTEFGPAVMANATTLAGNRDLTPRSAGAVGAQIAFEIGGSDRDNELNFVTWSPFDPDNDPHGLLRYPIAYGGPLGEWINWFYTNTGNPAANSEWHQERLSGVIAAQWAPIPGALSYNMYVAKLPPSPTLPPAPSIAVAEIYATGITRTSHFVRDVQPDYWYFIWVLAVNEHGEGPVGLPFSGRVESARSQIQVGTVVGTGYERGDYVRNPVLTILGEGTVHLSWDRADRSTWYEVYFFHCCMYGVAGPGGPTGVQAFRHTTGGTTAANNREMDGERWTEGSTAMGNRRQVPYRPFHRTVTNLAQATLNNLALHTLAIPWNDRAGVRGNPGEIHRIHALETTITGLDPDRRYWFIIRSPNHNGERGYVRVPWESNATGTNFNADGGVRPTLAGLTSPANVQVSSVSPAGGGRLRVTWDPVPGALTYRVYFSSVTSTPVLTLPFNNITNPATTTVDLIRLTPGVSYNIWVVATGPHNAISPFGPAVVGIPNAYDGTEPVLVRKYNREGGLVQNMLYIEVNDNDPRIALGYILETGEQFFDHVILFAANMRIRNCAIEGCPSHRCTQSGPHLHYNGNVAHILNDLEQYIRPLQRAGIRVSLGTLPDHDNFTYHSLGPWFAESSFPWHVEGRYNPGVTFHSSWWTGDPTVYPFSDEAVINGFIEQLISELERLDLDGFDIDDEWATSGIWTNVQGVTTFPAQYGAAGGARDLQITQNYANFIWRARQRMNASTNERLNNNRGIISLYRFGAPRGNMVGTAQFGPGTIPGIPGDEIFITGDTSGAPNIWTFLTKGQAAIYPESLTANWFGMPVPRAQYAPNTAGFHNWSIAANSTLNTLANLYRGDDPFQWKIWYGMSSGVIEQNLEHINRMAYPVFGRQVIYVGPDFPQNWIRY